MTMCGVLPGSVSPPPDRMTHFELNIDQTLFNLKWSILNLSQSG